MGMTMTQQILAAHAGLESCKAGDLIEAKLDLVMANDITGPMALPIIQQMCGHVFDKDKVVFVPDHFTPNKDIKSAENSKAILDFSKLTLLRSTLFFTDQPLKIGTESCKPNACPLLSLN